MEVILLESLNKLGKIGDVVNVKDGFARNYLIPKKKALRANEENKKYFTKIKDEVLEKNKQTIENAKSIIKKIAEKEIIFIRNASDNGQLYGSVSPKDISNYFEEQKLEIKPSNINLHNVIKKIGIYDINIKLHADVSCNLKINVATSTDNAKLQKTEAKVKKDDEAHTSKKNISKNKPLASNDKSESDSNKLSENEIKKDKSLEKKEISKKENEINEPKTQEGEKTLENKG